MSETMPDFLGPYRIEKLLGAGGMGEVYQAYDERLGRRVAVKHIAPKAALKPRIQARFRREARAAAVLSHPAIVQIFDILEREDGDWIVMELAAGTTISKLLRVGTLDLKQVLTLGRDVAEGLGEAHEAGIVHRDLKAENVIATPKGRAKILDFGLAKELWGPESEASISLAGVLIGTCRAMSPEQAKGSEMGPATDLFSLGTLLYEMTTGRSPFRGKTDGDTLHRVISHRPPSIRELLPEMPQELSDLVDWLHEKSPADRPESAESVAAVLAAIDERLFGPTAMLAQAGSMATLAGEPLAAEPLAGEPLATEQTAGTRYVPETSPPPRSPTPSPSPLPRSPSPPPSLSAPSPYRATGSGERRQVTVMSCELGPAGRDEPLDPEELLVVMPDFQRLVATAIEPFEGRIETEAALSAAVTVLFGYPRAHADDASRAALGALAIIKELDAQHGRFEGAGVGRLAVRVGIHTGTAVVAQLRGDRRPPSLSRLEDGVGQLALGETLNLAVGVRGLAEPGTVAASESTRRLIRNSFTSRPLEEKIPGSSRNLAAHRILEYSDTNQLLEFGSGGIDQVSRQQELEQMLGRWELAREGAGQVVLLSGEAGIGKTRLIQSLKGRLVTDSRMLVECRCTPYHRHKAFFPFVDFLGRVVARADWLEPGSEEAAEDLPLARFIPRLAALLEAPQQQRDLHLGRDLEAQGQKVLESAVALLLEMAEHRTVLLVVEDLHWVDPSTLELLTLLIEQVPTSRMLLLLSFRHGFKPTWGHPSYLAHITLSRLPDKQVNTLIDLLAAGRPIPPLVRREILERADGIPLFVEELTKLVLDSSQEDSGERAIPATLQGWLTARLDRLGPAKEVAQLAAALGREFSHELLSSVAGLDEKALGTELDRLVEAEILHRRGLPPRVVYTFKHGLLRDAAHESLLKSGRRNHHRRIAHVLRQQFPDIAEKEPELLAHHYAEAGLDAEAVACWRRAAENAVRSSIHVEAVEHAREGLRLVEALPPDQRRHEEEMALAVYLGLALSAKGYDAPEVEEAFARARELWPRVDKVPYLFPILDSLVIFYFSRGRIRLAREMAEELLHLAEEAHDVEFLPAAHWTLGLVLLIAGEFSSTKFYVEEGVAFYATQLSLEANVPPGAGLAVSTCLGDLSWALWFLGRPDEAKATSANSLDLISNSPDAFTHAFALFRAGYLHVYLRDPAAVRELAEQLTTFATERGFLYFVAMGMFLSGQVLAAEGRPEEGVPMMSEGLDGMWATGRMAGRTRNLALIAEACLQPDMAEQGLSLVREGLALTEKSGESHYEAELYRLQGELLLLQSTLDPPEGKPPENPEKKAEDVYRRSLDLARRQGARSLELRAAMSLARLRRSQGWTVEARDLLAAVYEGFDEGFETADLEEAKALLESLAVGSDSGSDSVL